MATALLPFPLILLCSLFSPSTAASDTLSHAQSIRDGETLLSPNGQFALGFFSPTSNSSTLRYLGVWYTFSNRTVVWVANRRNPIRDSSGVLTLTANGTLVLVYHPNVTAWTSATTSKVATVPKARLSNSGNLVVTDGSGRTTWQSFDHPSDTMLPGMKVGLDLQTGNNWSLTSWKSPEDPSPGNYVYEMNPAGGSYEIYVKRTGANIITYRQGRWNGIFFSGRPDSTANIDLYDYIFVANQDEVYFSVRAKDTAVAMSRAVMSSLGRIEGFVWASETGTWISLSKSPMDSCIPYETCGPNGVCSAAGQCECYVGYAPMKPELWRLRQYENGCEREERELCGVGEGFRVETRLKLPDTKNANVDYGKSLDECRELCLRNCKCNAYAAANISGGGAGSGCIRWGGDLVDSRQFTVDGQDLYLRVAASELADSSNQTHTAQEHKKRNVTTIFIAVPLVTALVVVVLGALIWIKRKNNRSTRKGKKTSDILDTSKIWDGELQSFDLAAIALMTDNFANKNKIGEGGFGSVYKGRIRNEQEVAVKRLYDVSRQGIDEFMNEVVLIGKLQHRNLVRLLGFCITEEERILIYEYMSNKSLDTFIFGKTNREMLRWRKRVDIIMGIARGLLYLHQDSRFRIIHRDLKAGNILLDKEMNPRISDFGTARLFKGDQLKEGIHTGRVIGTYGYMSPEYAMDGIYSVKSDAFSFGVLVLEIISGRKNRALYEESQDLNLLALAWRLWKEDRALELLDGTLTSSCLVAQVLRHIQIALLCVQEFAEDRPTMSTVAFMLSNESSPLPQPRRPGFCKTQSTAGLQSERESSYTINQITLTNVDGR